MVSLQAFISGLWSEFADRVHGENRYEPIATTWIFVSLYSFYATALWIISAYFFPALGFGDSIRDVEPWTLPLVFLVFFAWGGLVRAFEALKAGIPGFRLRSMLLVFLFAFVAVATTGGFSWGFFLISVGYGFVVGTVFETYCHPLISTEFRNKTHAELVLNRWLTDVKFALTFGTAIFLGIILGTMNESQGLYRPAMVGIGPLIGIASLFVYWNWKHISVEDKIEKGSLE